MIYNSESNALLFLVAVVVFVGAAAAKLPKAFVVCVGVVVGAALKLPNIAAPPAAGVAALKLPKPALK